MRAQYLMLIAGISVFILTIYWVRKREIREKYAVAWIGAVTIALAAGIFPKTVMRLARLLHLGYPSFILLICLVIGYFFAACASIALSRQYRRNLRLTQELALLENRLRKLEESQQNQSERKEKE